MSDIDFEIRLHDMARGMEYPHTPDVAGSIMPRLGRFDTVSGRGTVSAVPAARPRLFSRARAWSLTLVLILFLSLMLIPPARAAILEFIQICVVRIFPRSPSPIAEPQLTALPGGSLPLNRIAGETTFAEAQSVVGYPILLPSYPSDLGVPDHVFVQEAEGAMTILVWNDPNQPEKVILSLHFIPEGSWVIRKVEPVALEVTEVDGHRAVWAEGPYLLELDNGTFELTRLVEGHVLIWTEGQLTLRLETSLGMVESIRIAESLEPIP